VLAAAHYTSETVYSLAPEVGKFTSDAMLAECAGVGVETADRELVLTNVCYMSERVVAHADLGVQLDAREALEADSKIVLCADAHRMTGMESGASGVDGPFCDQFPRGAVGGKALLCCGGSRPATTDPDGHAACASGGCVDATTMALVGVDGCPSDCETKDVCVMDPASPVTNQWPDLADDKWLVINLIACPPRVAVVGVFYDCDLRTFQICRPSFAS